MPRFLKWLAFAAAALLLVGAALVWALHLWLATDDFRERVEHEASAALGVPLKLGRLSVDAWPLPAVAVDQLRIQSRPEITLARVEARPRWGALLAGRVDIATLVVRDAVIPAPAIAAIGAAMERKQGKKPSPAKAQPVDTMAYVPRRLVLDRVTWVDDKGARMTIDARASLDDGGLLESASMKVLQGRFAGAKAEVEREGQGWPVRIDIGGGQVAGRLQLAPGKGDARTLSGQLETKNVEVAALTAPSRTLTGKLEAKTSLTASFRDVSEIADVLQTRTQFTVRGAVIHGIDLAQAVQTVGMNRSGETRLDTLAGQLVSQGRAVQLTNLVASSGAMAATGNIAMSPAKNLSGRVSVELASSKGTVGVPLAVGGTLDSPSVTLSQGALVGAAVGTLLAPGVGTGVGAGAGDRLGDKLKGLFGK